MSTNSLKHWFGNRTMTSNCDVTNSTQQIQMTTLCHWMKPLPWKFSAYATEWERPVPCTNHSTAQLIEYWNKNSLSCRNQISNLQTHHILK